MGRAESESDIQSRPEQPLTDCDAQTTNTSGEGTSAHNGATSAKISNSSDTDKDQDELTVSLEQQKLRAEIDEIRLRIREQSSGKWQKWTKAAVAYLAVLIPLGIGVGGFLQEWAAYQTQKERLARFEVGAEVIQLVEHLSNERNSNLQRMAALELAWFGRPAVLILHEQLIQNMGPKSMNVRDAILTALVEVARIEKNTPAVLEPVIQSTMSFVDRELKGDNLRLPKLESRLAALQAVIEVMDSLPDGNVLTYEVNGQKMCSLKKEIENKAPQLNDVMLSILAKLSIDCK